MSVAIPTLDLETARPSSPGRISRKLRSSIGRAISDFAMIEEGDRVMVVSGPFAGVTGTFVRYGGQGRVIVNIEALEQYAGVEVNQEDLEILPKILS